MTREERMMMFKSRIPSLIGEKQRAENRMITQNEIAIKTGLARATVSKWVKPGEEIGYLDPDIAAKLCEYFACTLNELVTIEPRTEKKAT